MCEYCKELNTEPNRMYTDGLYINCAGYYNYRMPIIYCPYCGKLLNRYKKEDGTPNRYEMHYGY